MADGRNYYIPRKVNSKFTIKGLGGRELVAFIIIVIITAMIDYLIPLPIGGKVVISTLLIGGSYMLFTQEIGYGLVALEYFRLHIRYYLIDQNLYTLTTGHHRRKEDRERIQALEYSRQPYSQKILDEHQEVIVSEWEDKRPAAGNVPGDYDGLDEEQIALIPKPKVL